MFVIYNSVMNIEVGAATSEIFNWILDHQIHLSHFLTKNYQYSIFVFCVLHGKHTTTWKSLDEKSPTSYMDNHGRIIMDPAEKIPCFQCPN